MHQKLPCTVFHLLMVITSTTSKRRQTDGLTDGSMDKASNSVACLKPNKCRLRSALHSASGFYHFLLYFCSFSSFLVLSFYFFFPPRCLLSSAVFHSSFFENECRFIGQRLKIIEFLWNIAVTFFMQVYLNMLT